MPVLVTPKPLLPVQEVLSSSVGVEDEHLFVWDVQKKVAKYGALGGQILGKSIIRVRAGVDLHHLKHIPRARAKANDTCRITSAIVNTNAESS